MMKMKLNVRYFKINKYKYFIISFIKAFVHKIKKSSENYLLINKYNIYILVYK